jgi:hypothetical protein
MRIDWEETAFALERLGVVLSVDEPGLAGRLDRRKNPLADYKSAFSNQTLLHALTLIKAELIEEIKNEMQGSKLTRRLLDGVDGQPIEEKRRAVWQEVPKPKLAELERDTVRAIVLGEESEPILLQIIEKADGDVSLTVRLNHPLYIMAHSGARPHPVPPDKEFHVFPSEALLAKNERAQYSKYGPKLFDLREVPWREKEGPHTYIEQYRNKKGVWLSKRRRTRLKLLTRNPLPAGPLGGHPFLRNAWYRVIARYRYRTMELITKRMQGRGLI